MKTFGTKLLLVGIVMMCIDGYLAFDRAQDARTYDAAITKYQRDVSNYYKFKWDYPDYPNPSSYSDNRLILTAVVTTGTWIFLGGCILRGAGAATDRIVGLHRFLGYRLPLPETEQQAPAVPTTNQSSESPPSATPLAASLPSSVVASAKIRKKLSAWWPASPTGIALLCVWLALTFFAPMARRGGSLLDGLMGAGINYFIVIAIRYFVVVLPSRK